MYNKQTRLYLLENKYKYINGDYLCIIAYSNGHESPYLHLFGALAL